MTKDAIATMGSILPDEAGGKDAVHVAVFSAVADETVHPGQAVALVQDGEPDSAVSAKEKHKIGIVDPFLSHPVQYGERFWVYLYPRTITGLSHQWTHPAFDDADTVYATPSNKLASEQWLRDFCQKADCPGYEAVLGKAAQIADGHNDAFDDEYMQFTGVDAHGEIPDEFWDHVEIVLGRPVQGERARYFTCSC